jgi:hypothetical protein
MDAVQPGTLASGPDVTNKQDRVLNVFNHGGLIKRNLLEVTSEFLPHSRGNLHYL